MKTKLCSLLIVLALIAGVYQAAAQATQFFRIVGPAATSILSFNLDGTLVWSSTVPGTNYIIQTVTSVPGETNWVDYVQIPITNSINTNQIVILKPPAGMAFIPAGVFTMGDALDGESDAIPTNITVSAFYMDVNLVGYSQWQTVYNLATNNGYAFSDNPSGKGANQPALEPDWNDVVKWCNARSQQAGLTPVYYTDSEMTQIYTNGEITPYVNWTNSGYRLPTEAEWEKAARGGLSGQRFPWGDTISESQANYNGDTNNYSYDLGPNGYNSAFTNGALPYISPVGYFAPNGYGLYDMAGNVWEWCWDWYGTPYGQPTTTNPTGPTVSPDSSRVVRGGGWDVRTFGQRCADRAYMMPGYAGNAQNDSVGFRCVRGF